MVFKKTIRRHTKVINGKKISVNSYTRKAKSASKGSNLSPIDLKKRFTRTVDKVIDGDTFRTKRKVNGSNYIRLEKIDTPEKKQHGYQEAKNALRQKIEGKKVTITSTAKGHFGRPIAKVTQNRTNISKFMSKFKKKGGEK